MTNLFSDDVRRNPYPLYDQIRAASPLFRDPVEDSYIAAIAKAT